MSKWNSAISTDTPPAPIVTKSSSATRTDGCTFTAFTEPVIAIGPTKTEYTLTTYTSALYDCDGCEDIDVVVLGHIFVVRTLFFSLTYCSVHYLSYSVTTSLHLFERGRGVYVCVCVTLSPSSSSSSIFFLYVSVFCLTYIADLFFGYVCK